MQQGKQFLSKHEGSSSSGSQSDADQSLLLKVIENLRKQLAQVEEQWKQLLQKSEEWQKILDEVIHVGFLFWLRFLHYLVIFLSFMCFTQQL